MKKGVFPAFLAVLALCIPATPATAAIDATAKVKVLLQKSTFDAASATTTNTYFLKNASTATLTGPLRVVLESLDNRDVALLNPDGYGKPRPPRLRVVHRGHAAGEFSRACVRDFGPPHLEGRPICQAILPWEGP